MKLKWSLCLLCLALASSVAEPARRTGSSGRSRGSSRGSSRSSKVPASAPSGSASLDHHGLSSLSYSGYSQGAAKQKPKPQPKPSAPQDSRPVGWNTGNGDTAVRKNAGTSNQAPPQQSHSYPSGSNSGSNVQQNHAYPVGSNQQSHSYPSGSNQQSHAYPASGNAGSNVHAYPPSSGLSGGKNQAPGYGNVPVSSNAQQSHAYPASGGLSGHGAGAPPAYPAQQGAVPHYSQAGYPYPNNNNQHVGYPVGGNPSYTGGFPSNVPQNYPGYSQPGMNGAPMGGFGGKGGMGGYGGMGGMGYGGYGGYGNNKYGAVSRGPSVLTGLGIAGAGVGTILTGLALYNLARGGTRSQHHHHYYNNGTVDASAEKPDPATEAMLANLANCTLTMASVNGTEVVAIPCVIATSFAPNNNAKTNTNADQTPADANVNCTITVTSKDGSQQHTNIPCTVLLKLGENATNSEPPQGNPNQPPLPLNDPNYPSNMNGTFNPAMQNPGYTQYMGQQPIPIYPGQPYYPGNTQFMQPIPYYPVQPYPGMVNQSSNPAMTNPDASVSFLPNQPRNSSECNPVADGAVTDLKCLPPSSQDDLSVIPLSTPDVPHSTQTTAPAA